MMNIVVLSTAFLFSSCQQKSSIVGKWKTAQSCLEFTEEGSWSVVGLTGEETGPFDFGNYTFDGNLLSLDTDTDSAVCAGQSGKYNVDFTAEGKISFKLVEDECSGRSGDLAQGPYGNCEP
ncbi:MAG: hypothetical protein P8Z37_09005 [Acidobacteriota bacterium]